MHVKVCVRARARLASGQVRRGEKSKYGNRRKTKRSGLCEKVREKEREREKVERGSECVHVSVYVRVGEVGNKAPLVLAAE